MNMKSGHFPEVFQRGCVCVWPQMSKSVALDFISFPASHLVKCTENSRKRPENSQRTSGHVEDHSYTWWTQNWKSINISGWKSGAIHIEDVKGRRWCWCKQTHMLSAVEFIRHVWMFRKCSWTHLSQGISSCISSTVRGKSSPENSFTYSESQQGERKKELMLNFYTLSNN